jgi:hypothetical protein
MNIDLRNLEEEYYAPRAALRAPRSPGTVALPPLNSPPSSPKKAMASPIILPALQPLPPVLNLDDDGEEPAAPPKEEKKPRFYSGGYGEGKMSDRHEILSFYHQKNDK